jgi:bifunctional UDP-N-acetylglucosamine pyrophosphorylase/glucosamine-1-phosphate N-acetyltransferase
MNLHVVILAAGRGTRMKSALPKVLHQIAGRPMLAHVIDTARKLAPQVLHIVHGHGTSELLAAFAGQELDWVHQEDQRGTGHAVAQALPLIPDAARVLILYGDVPCVREQTLATLLRAQETTDLAVLTTRLVDPQGYGRIVRGPQGFVDAIREERDASEVERSIDEVNTGLMVAQAGALRRWLGQIQPHNAQGELYLTDIVSLAAQEGVGVVAVPVADETEVRGVNDRLQLAGMERIWQTREAERLMRAGVTLADPARIDVRGDLHCETDVFIDVGCVFEGTVRLAQGVRVGPYCILRDCHVETGTEILSHCVLEGARIGEGARVGPYARLRPGSELGDATHIGNFVEVKKATLGEGTKVNHLSYVGDAEIGRGVNIGAGTITCNYDGANKHLTRIGDDVFVGSDTQLIAPVSIGNGATIGAGSTITRDVPEGALALSRVPQRLREDWVRPRKKEK